MEIASANALSFQKQWIVGYQFNSVTSIAQMARRCMHLGVYNAEPTAPGGVAVIYDFRVSVSTPRVPD
jgi:hypothetical protein